MNHTTRKTVRVLSALVLILSLSFTSSIAMAAPPPSPTLTISVPDGAGIYTVHITGNDGRDETVTVQAGASVTLNDFQNGKSYTLTVVSPAGVSSQTVHFTGNNSQAIELGSPSGGEGDPGEGDPGEEPNGTGRNNDDSGRRRTEPITDTRIPLSAGVNENADAIPLSVPKTGSGQHTSLLIGMGLLIASLVGTGLIRRRVR